MIVFLGLVLVSIFLLGSFPILGLPTTIFTIIGGGLYYSDNIIESFIHGTLITLPLKVVSMVWAIILGIYGNLHENISVSEKSYLIPNLSKLPLFKYALFLILSLIAFESLIISIAGTKSVYNNIILNKKIKNINKKRASDKLLHLINKQKESLKNLPINFENSKYILNIDLFFDELNKIGKVNIIHHSNYNYYFQFEQNKMITDIKEKKLKGGSNIISNDIYIYNEKNSKLNLFFKYNFEENYFFDEKNFKSMNKIEEIYNYIKNKDSIINDKNDKNIIKIIKKDLKKKNSLMIIYSSYFTLIITFILIIFLSKKNKKDENNIENLK